MKPLFDPKDELIRLSQNDKERALYESREKANKDRTSALETAENKGIEIGRKEGLEEGREKGREEGLLSGKIEIIENGLKNNIPIETLSLLTNLTIEEVREIIDNIS